MSKSVLIVDDSSSVRTVVGIALRGAGYEVLEANDGTQVSSKCAQPPSVMATARQTGARRDSIGLDPRKVRCSGSNLRIVKKS